MKRFSFGRLFSGTNDLEQRLKQFNVDLEQQVREKTVEIIKSREKYFSLINTVDGIVWEADAASFRFTFVSKKAERLLGYPVDRWLEEGFWADHIHPDDRQVAVNYCIQSTSEKKPHEFEYRMIAADGSIIWIRDIVSLEISDGQVMKLKGIMIDITQSKKAERILKDSEEKYRTLVENAPEALVVFDLENRQFVSVSESATKLFRMPKEKLLTIGPADISPEIQPDGTPSVQGIKKYLDDAIAGKKPVFEWTHCDAEGNQFPCEVRLVRLPSSDRVLIRGSVINITERKKAEKDLKEKEKLFRDLLDSAPDATLIVNQEGKIVLVNRQVEKIFGYSYPELVDQNVEMLLPDEYRDQHSGHRSKFFEDAKVRTMGPGRELFALRKGGEKFPVEISISPLQTSDGLLVLASIRDITERKRTESILRENEIKFRAFFESSMDGFFLTIPDGKILMANPAACSIFGLTEQEIIDRGREGLVDMADPNLPKLLEERRRTGKAGGELTMLRGDGTRISVEISSSIFKDAYGQDRTSMIIRDITERKKIEKQLQDSYKEIRQLTDYLQNIRERERSDIAREIHDELGQQLTALKMDVSWLTNQVITDDPQVKHKLSNLANMLDNTVKTVRRISSELRPSLLDDLGLVAAMDWHLHEFGRNFGLKTIFKEPGKDIELSEAVKTGLFRIFQESLTNVARHAEARKVKVALEEFPRHLSLKIEDDGKGFDASATRKEKTLGILGMKERTTMIGGNYKIKSNLGKGTVVEVTVPYELKTEA